MQRLEEKLRKQLMGDRYGSRVSLMKGTGITIRDTRRYQPGDAVRAINRKKTAKHDNLYVNEFDADQIAHVDLYLDINANWTTGIHTINREKIQQFLADYWLFAHKHQILTHVMYGTPAGAVHSRVATLAQALECTQELDTYISAYTSPGYTSSIDVYVREITSSSRRNISIIISDFLQTQDASKKLLEHLTITHTLLLIQVGVPTVSAQNCDYLSLHSPCYIPSNVAVVL